MLTHKKTNKNDSINSGDTHFVDSTLSAGVRTPLIFVKFIILSLATCHWLKVSMFHHEIAENRIVCQIFRSSIPNFFFVHQLLCCEMRWIWQSIAASCHKIVEIDTPIEIDLYLIRHFFICLSIYLIACGHKLNCHFGDS